MGAGAVGCYFGGTLARAGAQVALIGRARHVEAIARDGLFLDTKEFRGFVPVAASTDAAAAREASIVILAVKTLDTASAITALAPHLAPGATVVSLQNGVDNVATIRSIVPIPAIAAVVYVAAEMVGPGRVKHNGRGDLIVGSPAGDVDPAVLARVAATFERAGIPCRVSPAIALDLWMKLGLNCAFNAISALGRARYGRILAHPETFTVLGCAVAEIAAVARAEGIPIVTEELLDAARRLATAVPEALSSTAQDIGLGKRTEIDDFNGYVAARGVALGIPTPVNATLHALVKLLEGGSG